MVIIVERLQKVIAQSGIVSRRKAEELIQLGRVKVNGEVVTALGTKVSNEDFIEVDGVPLVREEKIYLLMNKPRGVISSTKDEKQRKTVISILPEEYQKYRLFPVGRLDYDTKGVILLTNDGELMNRLIGPQSNVEKEYLARVDGIINSESINRLARGIEIDGVKTRPAKVKLESIDRKHKSSLVRIVLTEGRYHQVKKMFLEVGHPVKRLSRVRFGNLTLEGLPEGSVRPLAIHELKQLYALSLK